MTDPRQARALLDTTIDERAFQQLVTETARQLGWLCYHPFDSRRSSPGFPDLVMVHPEHGVVFAELKREDGKLSPFQTNWVRALTEPEQVYEVYVWRPSDWYEIAVVLGGNA